MDSFHILLLGYISDGLIPIKEKRCRSSNRQHNRARQDPKRKEKEKKKKLKNYSKYKTLSPYRFHPHPSSVSCVCVCSSSQKIITCFVGFIYNIMIVSFWIYYTFLASSNISKKKLKEKKQNKKRRNFDA
jgi:hypothetical protein